MRNFVNTVSVSDVILLGMMADAADEIIILTRYCDNEQMDVAGITRQTTVCLENLEALFGEHKQCLTRDCYTKLMLKTLRRSVVLNCKGKIRILGDKNPQEQLTRCFQVIRGWLKLCLAEMQAEFPGFEYAQAFAVFEIRPPGHDPVTDDPSYQDNLDRLALAHNNIDAGRLGQQLIDFREDADNHFRAGWSAKESWVRALTQHDGSYPTDAIERVVQSWLSLSVSSSGVEQSFSKIMWVTERQTRSSPRYFAGFVITKIKHCHTI